MFLLCFIDFFISEGSHCSSYLSLKKRCGSNVFLYVGKGSVPVTRVTGM